MDYAVDYRPRQARSASPRRVNESPRRRRRRRAFEFERPRPPRRRRSLHSAGAIAIAIAEEIAGEEGEESGPPRPRVEPRVCTRK